MSASKIPVLLTLYCNTQLKPRAALLFLLRPQQVPPRRAQKGVPFTETHFVSGHLGGAKPQGLSF